MPLTGMPILDRVEYAESAREYLKSLPLEHFMESTPTGTQRGITLASFAVIRDARPDVHCFNELLIQYPKAGERRGIAKVVPDNLVVIHDGPLVAEGSFNTTIEPAPPFLALEYVSEGNARKDYHDNRERYERDLRMPYYVMFEPHKELLSVYRLNSRKRFSSVRPNGDERYAIPELELEVGLIDNWMRYWFRGRLVPLPDEMVRTMSAMADQLAAATERAAEAERRTAEAERQATAERQAREHLEAELARMKAEMARLRGR